YLVFVDYYSTGELTCFLFSETKKDASDFSPTSYIIEPHFLYYCSAKQREEPRQNRFCQKSE
ncbi:hypothetical protein LQF60_10820, partial [Tetragenococcus koreensis]|uniref:hypothetical protein n=1 Tax=Tetragenococcus koreensis TaxID=290335 RepID=UPI001F321C6F